ncbi:MAG: thiamine-phosphate kinase [Holophagales bacterium]|jgi:thiamine-monophosphate kinase|nr:thiamine-phosphate kinase [Holophagales bacterium]
MLTLSETSVVSWIQQHFPGGEALTDDCGSIPVPIAGETLLVTTDLMESGRHFNLEWRSPGMLGHKLLAVNLSDLDSSGARPLGFTLTLAIGQDIDPAILEQILEGLAEAANYYSIPITGGDTVGRERGLGLGITAFGAATRRLHRNGVSDGDNIYVDNMPGASHRGLLKLLSGKRLDTVSPDADIMAHLAPRPDIGLGVRLAEIPQVHACIDLSDGLSKDLRALAGASGVSIVVEPGLSDDSLYGGEDYSRCFASTLTPETLRELTDREFFLVARAIPKTNAPLLMYSGCALLPVEDRSFEHFLNTDQ